MVRKWGVKELQEQIRLSFETLYLLPDREAGWMRVKAVWPDYQKKDFIDQKTENTGTRRLPTSAEIENMYLVWELLQQLPMNERLICSTVGCVMANSARSSIPWQRVKHLCDMQKVHTSSMRRAHQRGLEKMVLLLAATF